MIDSTWLLFQRTQVRWLTRVWNPSSWVSDTIFWFPWALYECSTQTYIQVNTHTHKIINKTPLPKKKRKEKKSKRLVGDSTQEGFPREYMAWAQVWGHGKV